MTQPEIDRETETNQFDSQVDSSARANLWAATMSGNTDGGFTRAHTEQIIYVPFDGPSQISNRPYSAVNDLNARLDAEHYLLSPSATFSTPGDFRRIKEVSHSSIKENIPLLGTDLRTRFEHDADRIKHSKAHRRLAGKTQVHLRRSDHQRTRMTHTAEVEQIAVAISSALRLNTALTSAIALGHDCGHGPGGHASEDALSPFLPGGFNHAKFGADVTLVPLNLCFETLDGIRNHSWSLDTPTTPEAEVVSFSDRIAYVCHDLEDAISCGMVKVQDFPPDLKAFMGQSRGKQIDYFIRAVIKGTIESETIAMIQEYGEILKGMRAFNLEHIYRHPDCTHDNEEVISKLRELVEFLAENPHKFYEIAKKDSHQTFEGSDRELMGHVVEYVAGMTDNYAYRLHAQLLEKAPKLDPSALYQM